MKLDVVASFSQELAILHDTRRQSSVISRQPIELLVISREVSQSVSLICIGNRMNVSAFRDL